ncbi:glucuronoxylan 4-O-methyltransferase 2 [Salvia miltiorrhiza]|uniref:glucuronoxylan 4-O-methyltransferase 2 n=1 Tax=Salvia miltiorrhiza TaxID=226208 RepID=UPI0025AC934E|nr:glucuronoxylan 4-O-methyltransferase 2 [Salvia miltiorrhiza]
MPPEVAHYHHPSLTPKTPLLARLKHRQQGRMKFAKKKIIPLLLFILCSASIFRFLNTSTIFANFSASLPSQPYPRAPSTDDDSSLTEKETRFILRLLSRRVPCNLLVFGSADEYSSMASLNSGGLTIFVEDYGEKTSKENSNARVHKIVYDTKASEAYQLLRDARGNPDCLPESHMRCRLALRNLPREVYDTTWDVVVVDGPGGGTAESPGRMGSIYTAGLLARRGGNSSEVIVHDVDRMIEKWFSWEFLCEDNLVSSKGRFWHFQLLPKTNATKS